MLKMILALASATVAVSSAWAASPALPSKSPPSLAPPHSDKSLEQRVAELEAAQALEIFSLNGIFETRYDNISTPHNKNLEYFRLRFSLDLNAAISPRIHFYSRYTTVKFMNRWDEQGTRGAQTSDLTSADDYSKSGSDVVLEKAYVDFLMDNPAWILSVGRLPTVDGPPSDYWDGRARMGTYPLLSYNSVLDGAAATYKLDARLPLRQHMAWRMVYTPFSQYNLGSGGNGAYVTPPADSSGNSLRTHISLYALQVDYTHDEPGFADSFNMILQHFQTGHLHYTGNLSIDVGGDTLMLEAKGLGHSGWDLSYSLMLSTLRSRGYATTPGTGFGTSSDDETLRGSVSLVSARYRFDDRWFVGLEWVRGSRNLFYYSGAPENLTGFYHTRGEAYHLYLTRKLAPNLALRAGWSQQDPRYTPLQLGGAPTAGGERIDTYYAKMRLDF